MKTRSKATAKEKKKITTGFSLNPRDNTASEETTDTEITPRSFAEVATPPPTDNIDNNNNNNTTTPEVRIQDLESVGTTDTDFATAINNINRRRRRRMEQKNGAEERKKERTEERRRTA